MNFTHILLLAIFLCSTVIGIAQTEIDFLHPTNDCRMKTWWFFGYENTTKEGITADVKALKDAGFGGVVYYDQNHRSAKTSPGTPDDGFSPQWWDNLKFACKEANRMGLSFEINISNGYCAGGKWIDPSHAMQRVVSSKVTVEGGRYGFDDKLTHSNLLACQSKNHVSIPLPAIKGTENYVKDIAILAFPCSSNATIPYGSAAGAMRHFTARYNAVGKGRNGCMQKPVSNETIKNSPMEGRGAFSGYGWVDVPNIGTLQVSDDSLSWRDVITIEPMYRSQGGYFYRTNAFPATEGKYWRVNYNPSINVDSTGSPSPTCWLARARTVEKEDLREWSVGSEAMLDRWEERTGLHSDFAEDSRTPEYSAEEVIHSSDIIDLTPYVHDGILDWDVPQTSSLNGGRGGYSIVRLASVLTGAKSKHGRANLLGYECDKLSVEAAELHWNSYTQPIIDTLREAAPSLRGRVMGETLVGVTMDSHEGGAQNWTPLMLQEFEQRRGYSLKPYLLMLAGYVVDSKEKTEQVLYDFRQTIADCVRDNYFGTFQRLATKNGLTFTAQAIGNALCIDGDAISVKKIVDKPQGEFWTYQKDGAYDIKDCSSACHLYGKPIASAEAMTDAMYDTNPEDLKHVADIAFSMGVQEFVVCATPHIPAPRIPGKSRQSGIPDKSRQSGSSGSYIAGREYAINRSNPKWNDMKWVWETSARSMYMLRQGKAAPDVLIFLGDDVPIKTLTSRLPDGIEGLDWDVCTGDALLRMSATVNEPVESTVLALASQQVGVGEHVESTLTTPEGIHYSALIIEKQAHISPVSQAKIEELRKAGVLVLYSSDGTCAEQCRNIERPITVTDDKGNILDSRTIAHTHRKVNDKDMFFLANITSNPVTIKVKCSSVLGGNAAKHRLLWRTATGKVSKLKANADSIYTIPMDKNESVFIY